MNTKTTVAGILSLIGGVYVGTYLVRGVMKRWNDREEKRVEKMNKEVENFIIEVEENKEIEKDGLEND